MSDVVERAKAALDTQRAKESHFWPRPLVSALVAEVEKWREVAERINAYSPDELDTEISSLGDYMIVDGQCWGRYAIEGILDALNAKDQFATDLIERIEKWKAAEPAVGVGEQPQ